MKSTNVIKGGQIYPNVPNASAVLGGFLSDVGYFTKRYWDANTTYTQQNNFWNFAISPGSKRYIPGLKNIAIDNAAEFAGASILYNRGGRVPSQ